MQSKSRRIFGNIAIIMVTKYAAVFKSDYNSLSGAQLTIIEN